MPIKSESGAKIGIVKKALLEPEGIKKLITACIKNAAQDATNEFKCEIIPAI